MLIRKRKFRLELEHTHIVVEGMLFDDRATASSEGPLPESASKAAALLHEATLPPRLPVESAKPATKLPPKSSQEGPQ